MTDQQQQAWRAFHEASRLNRYQRQELDALEKLLHVAFDDQPSEVCSEP